MKLVVEASKDVREYRFGNQDYRCWYRLIEASKSPKVRNCLHLVDLEIVEARVCLAMFLAEVVFDDSLMHPSRAVGAANVDPEKMELFLGCSFWHEFGEYVDINALLIRIARWPKILETIVL